MERRLAVITGSSRGIGKALVEEFARQGFDLVVNGRSPANLEGAVQEWRRTFPETQFYPWPADLGTLDGVESFARYVKGLPSIPEVLINNAGVFLSGSLLGEPADQLDLLLRTNVFSAYHVSRALVPAMVQQGRGHVFNMCSVASIMAYPQGGSYSISKFALLGFSKGLREELKSTGVRVTAVLPGATLTDSWAGVDLPASRFMSADDVARAVYSCLALSSATVVEELVLRPQEGDI